MDEEELLTPYKEVSFEMYDQHEVDSSSFTSDNNSHASFDEEDVDVLRRLHLEATNYSQGSPVSQAVDALEEVFTSQEDDLEVEESTDPAIETRKRGRPRKPLPSTPDQSEVEEKDGVETEPGQDISFDGADEDESLHAAATITSTPVIKKRGRPRKGEPSSKSHMELMKSLEYIIPEGTKRQSRPSRFLEDYDSCLPRSVASSSTDEGEYVKRGRGRPRTRPPKEIVLMPDGTPRGRGRPRTRPRTETGELILGNSMISTNYMLNDSVNSEGVVPTDQQENQIMEQGNATSAPAIATMNGMIRIKRPRGRPRIYPRIEKSLQHRKRIAKPGKKLGRPRKGEEKNRICPSTEKKASDQSWHIKWNGIFKYVTGGKGPICKTEIIGKLNGVGKVKKSKSSGLVIKKEQHVKCESTLENNEIEENILTNKLVSQEELIVNSEVSSKEVRSEVSSKVVKAEESMDSSYSEDSLSSSDSDISMDDLANTRQRQLDENRKMNLYEDNIRQPVLNESVVIKKEQVDYGFKPNTGTEQATGVIQSKSVESLPAKAVDQKFMPATHENPRPSPKIDEKSFTMAERNLVNDIISMHEHLYNQAKTLGDIKDSKVNGVNGIYVDHPKDPLHTDFDDSDCIMTIDDSTDSEEFVENKSNSIHQISKVEVQR